MPINASCGAYSSASKSTGLLSFETVNGNPDPTKLCTNSVLYNNAILGNGSLATPWQWQCFRSENSSIANCQNTYTKTGKCGAVNGTSLTTAPSVSASMCTQGRWYNKATTGLVANASIWNAEAKTWTWACLGHNPTTLTMSNDLCSAKKCAECTGATESDAIKPFSGTYDDCSFDSNNAQLIFRQVIKHQTNSSDVSALISFGSGGHGMLTLPTTIAKGYCSPCYDKTIGIISSKVQIDSSCVLSPPRGYSASVLLQ